MDKFYIKPRENESESESAGGGGGKQKKRSSFYLNRPTSLDEAPTANDYQHQSPYNHYHYQSQPQQQQQQDKSKQYRMNCTDINENHNQNNAVGRSLRVGKICSKIRHKIEDNLTPKIVGSKLYRTNKHHSMSMSALSCIGGSVTAANGKYTLNSSASNNTLNKLAITTVTSSAAMNNKKSLKEKQKKLKKGAEDEKNNSVYSVTETPSLYAECYKQTMNDYENDVTHHNNGDDHNNDNGSDDDDDDQDVHINLGSLSLEDEIFEELEKAAHDEKKLLNALKNFDKIAHDFQDLSNVVTIPKSNSTTTTKPASLIVSNTPYPISNDATMLNIAVNVAEETLATCLQECNENIDEHCENSSGKFISATNTNNNNDNDKINNIQQQQQQQEEEIQTKNHSNDGNIVTIYPETGTLREVNLCQKACSISNCNNNLEQQQNEQQQQEQKEHLINNHSNSNAIDHKAKSHHNTEEEKGNLKEIQGKSNDVPLCTSASTFRQQNQKQNVSPKQQQHQHQSSKSKSKSCELINCSPTSFISTSTCTSTISTLSGHTKIPVFKALTLQKRSNSFCQSTMAAITGSTITGTLEKENDQHYGENVQKTVGGNKSKSILRRSSSTMNSSTLNMKAKTKLDAKAITITNNNWKSNIASNTNSTIRTTSSINGASAANRISNATYHVTQQNKTSDDVLDKCLKKGQQILHTVKTLNTQHNATTRRRIIESKIQSGEPKRPIRTKSAKLAKMDKNSKPLVGAPTKKLHCAQEGKVSPPSRSPPQSLLASSAKSEMSKAVKSKVNSEDMVKDTKILLNSSSLLEHDDLNRSISETYYENLKISRNDDKDDVDGEGNGNKDRESDSDDSGHISNENHHNDQNLVIYDKHRETIAPLISTLSPSLGSISSSGTGSGSNSNFGSDSLPTSIVLSESLSLSDSMDDSNTNQIQISTNSTNSNNTHRSQKISELMKKYEMTNDDDNHDKSSPVCVVPKPIPTVASNICTTYKMADIEGVDRVKTHVEIYPHYMKEVTIWLYHK